MSSTESLMSKYKTLDPSQVSNNQPINNVSVPQPQQMPPAANGNAGLMSKYKTLDQSQIQKAQASNSQPASSGGVLQRLGDFVQPINDLGYATSSGLEQGAYDVTKSAVNFLPDTINSALGFKPGQGVPVMPELTRGGRPLRETISQSPLSQLAFETANIGAQGFGGVGVYNKVSAIPGLVGRTIPKMAARGALTGAITGEDAPGGRTLSGIVGGALGPAYDLLPSRVIKSVSKAGKEAQELASQKYTKWFEKVKDAGGDKLRAPDLEIDKMSILPNANKHLVPVRQFLENPTFETAHSARSALSTLQRASEGGLNMPEISKQALAEIPNAIKQIEGEGVRELVRLKKPELIDEYLSMKDSYRKDVVPYKTKAIKDYKYGYTTPSQAVKGLGSSKESNKDFVRMARLDHPDVFSSKKYLSLLKNYGSAAAKGAAYVAGGSATLGILNKAGLLPKFGGSSSDDGTTIGGN